MKNTVLIGFQIAPGADIDLPRPEKGTLGSSGFDLRANIAREGYSDRNIEIPAGQWKLIPTGLMLQIPLGYEGQVRPRSGLALKYGVTVLNAPGTIDSDYRGELGVILINHGTSTFTVEHGQRIAQIVFQIVPNVSFAAYEELSKTERNSGGYGSSGID